MSEVPAPVKFPELIFGLAGPIGVDLDLVESILAAELKQVNYESTPIKLTDEMKQFDVAGVAPAESDDLYANYNWKMNYANALRKKYTSADTLARIAIKAIQSAREEMTGQVESPSESHAYVVRQLKRPEEVTLLRRIYGRQFVLVSAYAPEADRADRLCDDLKLQLPTDTTTEEIRHKALILINRDASESEDPKLGQKLRETFPMADVFTDGEDRQKIEATLHRFVQALFGKNDISPNKDEYGMYAARSASLRSTDLSRQVGAAVFSREGELIAQGCNEVPKFGGGTYWDGETPDNRDVKKGFDPNERLRVEVLRNAIERLGKVGLLSEKAQEQTSSELVKSLVGEDGALVDSQIMDLTEYGRVLHAEMSVICDAARVGLHLKHSILYCTTFPCHNCTKHIIASGIERVVYMQPYPKSRAPELHSDEIELEVISGSERVSFVPFIGISPVRYREIFQKGKRKSDGSVKAWYHGEPKPMIDVDFPSYPYSEAWALAPLLGKTEAEATPQDEAPPQHLPAENEAPTG